jgi:plasmid stabilization system protein ParE
MTLPVVFRRAARREFDEAALWYEERRAGLGHNSSLRLYIVTPLSWCWKIHSAFPSCTARFDCVRARRFPYSVFFRAEAQRIVLLAVFYARRDPSVWHDRA